MVPAGSIIVDPLRRFVSDTEKADWNLQFAKGYTEEDVKELYVDAINGLNTGTGTASFPLRTIQEALSRGPKNIRRSVLLYETQEHIVDPANPAIVRGGHCSFYPYGPQIEALPNVSGGGKFSSLAAIALNTTIKALDYILLPDGTGGFYQYGTALAADSNSDLYTVGLTLIPGRYNYTLRSNPNANSGGIYDSTVWPALGNNKSFSYWSAGNVRFYFWYCKLKTTHVHQNFFGYNNAPVYIKFNGAVFFEGPGVLINKFAGDVVVNDSVDISDIRIHMVNENANYSGNGYEKLVSGLIIQWGQSSSTIGTPVINISYPIAFPNVVFSITGTDAESGAHSIGYRNVSTSYFTAHGRNPADFSGGFAPTIFNWIAIGY